MNLIATFLIAAVGICAVTGVDVEWSAPATSGKQVLLDSSTVLGDGGGIVRFPTSLEYSLRIVAIFATDLLPGKNSAGIKIISGGIDAKYVQFQFLEQLYMYEIKIYGIKRK